MKFLNKSQGLSNIHFLNERMLLLNIACLLIILPSILVLYGWLIEGKTLIWLFPNQVSMKANNALAFILASLALYLFNNTARWVYKLQRIIALFIFTLGISALYQYVTQTTLPYVDQWLINPQLSSVIFDEKYILSYRMSPLAAINLTMVSISIFLLSNQHSNRQLNIARLFVIPVILSSILVLIGYAYGVRDLYRFGFFVPLSPISAISFILLSISLLFIRAERGFMRLFVGRTLGSKMARWLLPTLIIVFVTIGWMCRQGNLMHAYNNQFEVSILIFLTLLLSSALIIWQSRIQHGQELLRQHAQHALELNNLALEKKVQQRTQQLENLMRELEILSLTDGLTGIANRRAFEQRLNIEWLRANRYHHPLSIVMMDIDHFKKINDVFGHQTGDEVLQQVAAMLMQAARNTDLVCRYGGEEFIVVMMDTALPEALIAAERFRTYIFSNNWLVTPVTVSIGVASLQANQTVEQLLKEADQALYQAKSTGRNQVVSFAQG